MSDTSIIEPNFDLGAILDKIEKESAVPEDTVGDPVPVPVSPFDSDLDEALKAMESESAVPEDTVGDPIPEDTVGDPIPEDTVGDPVPVPVSARDRDLDEALNKIEKELPVPVDTTMDTTENNTFGVGSLLTSPGSQLANVIQMKQTPTSDEVVIDDRIPLDLIRDPLYINTSLSKDNWNTPTGFSPHKKYLELGEKLFNLEKGFSASSSSGYPYLATWADVVGEEKKEWDDLDDDSKINWLAKRSSQMEWNIYEIFETVGRTSESELGNKIRNALGVNKEVPLEDQIDIYYDVLNMHTSVRPDWRTRKNAVLAVLSDPFSWVGGLATLGFKGVARLSGSKTLSGIPLRIIKKRMTSNLTAQGLSKKAIEEALENGATNLISREVLAESARQAARLKWKEAALISGSYMGTDNIARQLRKQNLSDSEIEENFNFGEFGQSVAIGTLFAPVIKLMGGTLPGVRGEVRQFTKKTKPVPKSETIVTKENGRESVTNIEITPSGAADSVEPPIQIDQTRGGPATVGGAIEETIDEVVPAGVAPVKKSRIKEGLGTVKRFTANLNSELGRLFRSDASLAGAVEDAARKLNSRKFDAELNRLDKELSTFNQAEKIEADVINNYINTGTIPEGAAPLPNNIKQVLDDSRKLISDNMGEINTLLGFKEGTGIGVQYKKNPDGTLGEMYVTRSYEAIYNPAFKDKLKSVLQNKKKSTQPKEIYESIEAGRTFIKEQLKLGNIKLTGERALTPAQVKQLENSSVNNINLDFNPNQLEEVDGLLNNILNYVSNVDKGEGIESLFTAATNKEGMVNALRNRNPELSPNIRKFLGETTDPRRRITETLIKQNEVIAKVRFLRDIDDFMRQVVKENPNAPEVTMKGLIPFLPTKKLPVREFLSGPAEVKLQEYARELLGSGQAGQSDLMRGLFTSPRMQNLIDNNINLLNNRQLSKMWKGIQLASSWTQATNTLTDPPAYLLNLAGDMTNSVLNGEILSPIKTAKNIKAGKKFFYDAIIKKDPDAVREFNFLMETGVIESGLVGENILRNVNFLTEGARQGSYKTVTELSGEVYAKAMGVGGKAYGASAAFTKYVMYKNELMRVRKSFPDMPLKDAQIRAAKTISYVAPTYSRAAPIAREIARTPVIGPYILFTSEAIRTSKNIPTQALKDIGEGTVRIKRGEKGAINQVNSGIRRLTGFVSGMYGFTQGVTLMNEERGVDGGTSEGVQEIIPSFLRGSTLMYLPAIPDGTGAGTASVAAIQSLYRKTMNKDQIPSEISAAIVENDRGQVVTRVMSSIQFNAYDPTTRIGKNTVRAISDVIAGRSVDHNNFSRVAERELVQLFGQYFSPKLLMGQFLEVINTDTSKGGTYDPLNTGISSENISIALEGFRNVMEPALFDVLREYNEVSLATDPKLLAEISRDSGINAYRSPSSMQDFTTFAMTGMRVWPINIDASVGLEVYKEVSKQSLNSKNFDSFIKKLAPQPYTLELEKEILEEYRDTLVKQFELAKELGYKLNNISKIKYQDSDGQSRSYGEDEGLRMMTAISDMGRRSVSSRVAQSYMGDLVNPNSENNAGLREGMFVPINAITRSLIASTFDPSRQKFSEESAGILRERLLEMQNILATGDIKLQSTDVEDIEDMLNNLITEMQE
jgi:hypothetical protein